MGRTLCSAAAALLVAALSGAPGQAQIPGDNSAEIMLCMRGELGMSEREVREAQEPAQALMSRYWALAAASDPADVTAAFRASGQVGWSSTENQLSREGLSQVHDSLALDEALALAPAPSMFARAGVEPGDNARGVWEVRSRAEPAAVAGYYYVEFQRDGRARWGIAKIVVIRAPASPPPVARYCILPGDIEAYAADREARRAARRARRQAR